MVVQEAAEAPHIQGNRKDEWKEDEGVEIAPNGTVLLRLPHLISDMTTPDRVKVLEWHVQEDDVILGNDEENDERDMVHLEFLGNDWYLPIPPFSNPMRVVRIEAEVGETIHLHDLLIVFEPVTIVA
jgi:hypothetical protein